MGLGALAALLATAAPATLLRAGRLAGQARENARLGAAAARGRVLGESFERSLEEIRRAIPADGAYYLIDEGSAFWVRYELAPRRALLLGELGRLGHRQLRLVRRQPLDWAVIAGPPGAPARLLPRQDLLAGLAGRLAP